MTVLHLGRDSFTEIVWQSTLQKLLYMEEETLTSMEINIQYNYSWRIRVFLGFFFNAPAQLTLSFHS